MKALIKLSASILFCILLKPLNTAFILTLCFIPYVKNINAQTCNRQLDSLTLIKLYDSTNGPNWLVKWDLQKPIWEWEGVVLNEEGCVQSLDLPGYGLNGFIPPEIGNFSQLEKLHLTNNVLKGVLPKEIGNLTSLWFLHLRNTQIYGEIPKEIGNMKSLVDLNLKTN